MVVATLVAGSAPPATAAAPETIITSAPPIVTNDTTPTFEFTSDTGVAFECEIDGDTFAPCASPFTTPPLLDDNHTFFVRAIDAADVVDDSPASASFAIDATPPSVLIGPSAPAITSDTTPTFDFVIQDANPAPSLTTCRVTRITPPGGIVQTLTPCASPYTAPPLSDGIYQLTVLATDAAGNLGLDVRDFTIDTTPPETTFLETPPGQTGQSVAFFSFASEPGATFACRLDLGAFAPCSGPSDLVGPQQVGAHTTGPLAEGLHTFEVRATDTVGNVDPTPASTTWSVDLTPPDTLLLETPPAIAHQAVATFTFAATEQPASFECSVDAGGFGACTSPFSTPALGDGPHTFAVRARDAADLVDATPAIFAWTVALGVSLCDDGPLVCKAPGATKLSLRNSTKDSADKLEFRWSLGDATTSAELGDPSVDTDYAVCVWDTVGGTPSLVMAMQAPPAGNCAGKPCWRSLHDGTAFRYKDFGLLPSGVQQLTIRSGPLGKASVFVKGRGLALPDPPMPFTQQPSIIVQVVNSLGNCWGADYVVAPRTNTAEKLRVDEKP